MKIAVAMSVYKTDNIKYVKESIDSILNQDYKNFDLFVEVDGPVDSLVTEFLQQLNSLENVFVNFNSCNKGLATRLNTIIDIAVNSNSYSFLARMDADDVSEPNRFSEQVLFLKNNKNVSVVGSDVIEISEDSVVIFEKKMDHSHELLRKNIIKKCPFNHPSVMFNMDVFYEGYRYDASLMNTQDYYLWIDLLSAGKVFANINKPLLKFRVSKEFHSRRGLKKAINDLNSRIYAFSKLDNLKFSDVIHTILLFLLRLSPTPIKKFAYKLFR